MAVVKDDELENVWIDDVSGEQYWIDLDGDKRVYKLDSATITEDEWCEKTQGIRRATELIGKYGATDAWVENSTGQYHREDAPAWTGEHATRGRMFTHYRHGLLHREGGPASYSANGAIFTYAENGALHREDGPAVKSEIAISYYVRGRVHRTDGPWQTDLAGKPLGWALDGKQLTKAEFDKLSPDAGLDRVETELGVSFFKAGTSERHRTAGPAIISKNGTCEHWVNGKRHRAGGLPAVYNLNSGDFECWVEGEKTQNPMIGPACVYELVDTGEICAEFWLNNCLHNENAPARFIRDDSGIETGTEYWLNNRRHNTAGPAIRRIVDGVEEVEYWVCGAEIQEEDFLSGCVGIVEDDGTEMWILTDDEHPPSEIILHRENGPAYINAEKTEYRVNGELHNERGPAVIWHADGKEEYWLYDEALTKEEWAAEAAALKEYSPQVRSEKVFKAGLAQEPGFTYFFANGCIMRSEDDEVGSVPEVVLKTDVEETPGSLYYIDQDGDVSMILPESDEKVEEIATLPDQEPVVETPAIPSTPPTSEADTSWGMVGGGAALALGLLAGFARGKKKIVRTVPTQTPAESIAVPALVPVVEPARTQR